MPADEHASESIAGKQVSRDRGDGLRGLRTVMSSTVLSRVLGMFRDMATADLFGLGPVMDAFSLAFRLPNLARRLFGEGALSTALLPAFARLLERAESAPGLEAGHPAWALGSAIFFLLAGLLTGLVLVGEGALLLASLAADVPETRLLLGLAAVMLPYSIFICLAALVTAMLQALRHFTWPALVPVVLNVCWIATIFLVDPLFEPDRIAQAYALAVCVLVSGVLQLALQMPPLFRLGFRVSWAWGGVWPEVRSIVAGMLPVALGLSIVQLSTVVDSLIAWVFSKPVGAVSAVMWAGGPEYPLSAGAVSALYFGERLYQFPLGVFGVALGTVLFPLLARHAARRDFGALRRDLDLGLRLVLIVGLPASAGLVLTAVPVTGLLYQRGEFTAADTERTAGMIAAYGLGVWAYCGIPVLYRAFYAVDERLAPLRVGMACVLLDAGLNVGLIWVLAEQGLAVSTAVTAAVQLVALAVLVQRWIGRSDWRGLGATGLKAAAATGVMVLVCFGVDGWLPQGPGGVERGLRVLGLVGAGGAAYGVAAIALGLRELWLLVGRGAGDGSQP